MNKYVKTDWVPYQTAVTSANMNNIEYGIESVTNEVIKVKVDTENLKGEVGNIVGENLVGITARVNELAAKIEDSGSSLSDKLNKTDNAVSASKLFNPRLIAGVMFDGTKDIDITAYNVGAKPENWVPSWSDITGKPSTYPAIIGGASNQAAAGNHTHSNYENSIQTLGNQIGTTNAEMSNIVSDMAEISIEIDRKEPIIIKNSGFNLDKSDAIDSMNGNTLATSLAVFNVRGELNSFKNTALTVPQANNLYEPIISKKSGFNLDTTDRIDQSNPFLLASAASVNALRIDTENKLKSYQTKITPKSGFNLEKGDLFRSEGQAEQVVESIWTGEKNILATSYAVRDCYNNLNTKVNQINSNLSTKASIDSVTTRIAESEVRTKTTTDALSSRIATNLIKITELEKNTASNTRMDAMDIVINANKDNIAALTPAVAANTNEIAALKPTIITKTGARFDGTVVITGGSQDNMPMLSVPWIQVVKRAPGTPASSMDGRLDVAGDTYVNGRIYCYGDITAFSDVSLKKNVLKIDNAIDKVKALNGYTYDMDDVRKSGVIAQEVEKVLPEVVSKNEDGLLSVAYGNMIGLLIEAIKEQQTQIDELKELLNGRI